MMLTQIINALEKDSDLSDKVVFFTEAQIDVKKIHIEVKGVGKLDLPLKPDTIQSLLDISQSAKFGLRSQTLLDQTVRDTKEISANHLQIDYDKKYFSRLLEEVRVGLGLPSEAELSAHLHNLLVYEQGHFFKPHQDSEKLEGMVASLIMLLPSNLFDIMHGIFYLFQLANAMRFQAKIKILILEKAHTVLQYFEIFEIVFRRNPECF